MKNQLITRIFLFIVIFSMLLSAVGMPLIHARAATTVTVEGTPSSGISEPTNSSISFSHTTGTGTNRLLLVGVSWNCGTTDRTISSFTFTPSGGSALNLSEVKTQQYNWSTNNYRYTAIYRLLAPPSGVTGSIAIGFSGAVSNGIIAGAVNFAGVDQTTPFGTTVGNTGTGNNTSGTPNPTVSLTGLTGNEMLFDSVFIGASSTSHSIAADSGQSPQWNVVGYTSSSTSFNAIGAGSTKPAPGTSTTMSWTTVNFGTTTTRWAIATVPIRPAPVGPTYNLTVAVSPSGGGTTNPPVGVNPVAQGSTVTVTATPNTNYAFSNWSGACTGSAACSILMNGDKTVTANFAPSIAFTSTELLGRPESDRISVKCIPNSAATIRYQYSTTSGGPYSDSSSVAATANQPAVITITGLTANTKYYYRMQYSTDGGTIWATRPEKSFWTKRAVGSTFTFDITSDGHVDIQLGNATTWGDTMDDVAGDQPDFALDLGDTVAIRGLSSGDTTGAETAYKNELPYFNRYSASAPVFLVQGNHEQTEGWHLQAPLTGSLPVIGTNAEKKFFLDPVPDAFYSGNTIDYTPLGGDNKRLDYYAWTWGDALFVVIDPFWNTTSRPYITDIGGGETDATGTGDSWDWTLGLDQFNWLKTTLSGSSAKYKFVFAHQLLGGWTDMASMNDYAHGGANYAQFVEWGGQNEGGGDGWAAHRNTASWGTQPIHQILVANDVSAFFHGHDHQGAYEERDGVAYVSIPNGSFTGGFGIYTTGDGYTTWADSSQAAGHVKVVVSPTQTTVNFIRTSTGATLEDFVIPPSTTTTYALTVTPAGTGTGTVTSSPTGIDCGVTCSANFTANSPVVLTAVAAAGSSFTNWSGAGCSGSGTCTVPMTAVTAVTATFTRNSYTLTVTPAGTGSGTVTSAPAGITCGGTCSASFSTSVTLTAAAAAGSSFTNWSGGGCSGSGTCTVPMTAATTVTATFTLSTYTLTVVKTGAGSGTVTSAPAGISCGSTCATSFNYNQVVVLSASASTGSTFAGWSGEGCSGTGTCSVTMTATRNVTANFTLNTYSLTVGKTGSGSGTVTSAPAGISCGATCSFSFNYNQSVVLTAVASAGSTFSGWSGEGCSGTSTCTVTMTAIRSVTASFTSNNVAPAAVNDTYNAEKNVTMVIDAPGVLANDTDPNLDPLTASKISNPSNGTVTLNSNGSFTYVPAADFVGTVSFTYQASDGSLSSNTATVTIHVLDAQPPILPTSFYGEIHINDSPPVAGNFVEAYVAGAASYVARVAITGTTTLTYAFDVPGDIPSTTPVEGGTAGGLVTFKINGRVVATAPWYEGTHPQVNFHPPQALPGGPYSGSSGVPIPFSGSANDWGSDVSTYEWDWNNDGTYDATGQNPSHAFASSATVALKVTDAQGGQGTATVAVTVTVTSYSVALGSGWNLVSFNLHPANTDPATVLSSVSGNYDLVYAWNATTGLWMKHDTIPLTTDTLTSLDETQGFWIKMNTAGTLTVSGSVVPTSNIALKTGWNLVGFPSSSTSLALPAAFSDHGVGTDYTLVYAYHAADTGDPWKKHDRTAPFGDDLLVLSHGWGFWIKVSVDHTWNVTY